MPAVQSFHTFGMVMPGRSFVTDEYRFGFNGKERESELTSNTSHYDFDARILDVRVAKWLSTDPKAADYPNLSGYSAFGNSPLYYLDPDGKVLKGATKDDVLKTYLAILEVLDAHEGLKNAIQISEDGLSIEISDKQQFMAQIHGLINTAKDEKNIANGIYRVINSKNIYQVSFVENEEYVSVQTTGKHSKGSEIEHGGGAYLDGIQWDQSSESYVNKVSIVFDEETWVYLKECEPYNICDEAELQNINPSTLIVSGVIGALFAIPDSYVVSKGYQKEEDEDDQKFQTSLNMIKIQNTINRIMQIPERSGLNRYGGSADDAYNKSKGDARRAKELDPPKGPRHANARFL